MGRKKLLACVVSTCTINHASRISRTNWKEGGRAVSSLTGIGGDKCGKTPRREEGGWASHISALHDDGNVHLMLRANSSLMIRGNLSSFD